MGKEDRWIVLSDFDGTITERDMCLALLETFATGDWQALDEAYDAGRIPIEECLAGQVAMFASPRAELVDYARREGRVRPGLRDLIDDCRRLGVPFGIVSAGLDFYIDAILDREGLAGLDRTYVHTVDNGDRISLVLPFGGIALRDGVRDFKEAVVRRSQAEGRRVAYIGDGSTDFAAARRADHVFARARLLAMCQAEGIDHTPFEDFHAVRKGLARLTGRGGS